MQKLEILLSAEKFIFLDFFAVKFDGSEPSYQENTQFTGILKISPLILNQIGTI